jgi:hypothetical protein
MQNIRAEVLAFFRRIIRLSKTWTAQDPANTEVERCYIRDEVRRQFRSNRMVCTY